jgi:putative PIN family toxin of toxin-antitoxin system
VTRVVLDANVIASGMTGLGGAPTVILSAWASEVFDLIISHHILDELERTLAKPYFQRMFAETRVSQEMLRFRTRGVIVTLPGELRGIARHSHDDPVLETAVMGNADSLVTGDRALRRLGAVRGVPILTPHEFLAVLDDPS